MIVKISQTKTLGKNEFNVVIDKELKYVGNSSGIPIRVVGLPMVNDVVKFRLFLQGVDGIDMFKANYKLFDNLIAFLTNFFVYLSGNNVKEDIVAFYDKNKIFLGDIFFEYNIKFRNQYRIFYNGSVLTGYFKAMGKTENIAIYNSDIQIAQIVKNVSLVNDYLDEYHIYIKDEFSSLAEVLSLFTIYYDQRQHSNIGKVGIITQYSRSHSWNGNDDKVTSDWLKNNFSIELLMEDKNIGLESSQDSDPKSSVQFRSDDKKNLRLVIGMIFIFIVGLTVLISIIGNSISQKSEIKFGDDQIPTLYNVTQNKIKISKYSTNINNSKSLTEVTYKDEISKDDLNEYLLRLKSLGWTIIEETNDYVKLSNESNDNNKNLYVEISSTENNQVKMTYYKM